MRCSTIKIDQAQYLYIGKMRDQSIVSFSADHVEAWNWNETMTWFVRATKKLNKDDNQKSKISYEYNMFLFSSFSFLFSLFLFQIEKKMNKQIKSKKKKNIS